MSKQFSLAYLTIPGVDPVAQIKIAAAAGYEYVSLRTIPMGLPGEPQVCLEKDPALAAEIRQALHDYRLKLLDIELVRIKEDVDGDYRGAFEQGAALGATQVISSVWTSDRNFAVDRLGSVCQQAAEFGLTVNLEFPIVSSVTTLADTAAIQQAVGASNLKIMVDMIYAHWAHVTPKDIQDLGVDRFGLVHLCDCPKNINGREVREIVREARAYCGEGAADVADLVKALPEGPYSIELPNMKNIQALGAVGHAARCLHTAQACLANV